MRFTRYVMATCAAALLAASPALAEDAATPAPAAAAQPAAPAAEAAPAAAEPAAAAAPATPAPAAPAAAPAAPAAAAPTIREVPEAVKAWAKFCDKDDKGKNICIVRKLAFDNGAIVGSFVLRIDPSKGVPMLAVAAVPVGVVLKPGLRWQIDKAKANSVPFWRCSPQSCESQQLVKPDFINRLKRGTNLKLIAKDINNKDLAIDMSLAGFTAAFDKTDAPTFEQYTKSLPQQ